MLLFVKGQWATKKFESGPQFAHPWFTLYKQKMSNLTSCELFCIQDFAYKNHLIAPSFSTLYIT